MVLGGPEFERVVSIPERERLQRKLVDKIEWTFIYEDWDPLDKRVKEAFLKVPRDRHIPPGIPLNSIYSNEVFTLNQNECFAHAIEQLANHGIILGNSGLNDRDIRRLVGILSSSVLSTASQSSLVALMTQSVLPEVGEQKREDRLKALDIGTGLGFQAALLEAVGFDVITIDINSKLAEETREIFQKAGNGKVKTVCADGRLGYPEDAPYDAIVVAAAIGSQEVVSTLIGQLSPGGRLVLPFTVGAEEPSVIEVGGQRFECPNTVEDIRLYKRSADGDGYTEEVLLSRVAFIHLR